MERQCAGCGKVFEDGAEPKGSVAPRPYGCCDDCNKASFKHKAHNFEEGKCTTCGVQEEDHKAFLKANPPAPKKVVASEKVS